jgi:glutamate dehydrogenase (NAD(P)+)
MIKHATDIEVDGVGFRHLITTRHGNITARTAIHRTQLPKRLGGVRFVEHGSVEEVCHLAIGMSQKAAAAKVPIDGLKCLIECPDGVPGSVADRAALVAAHLRVARRIDGDIIFGPDMLAPEAVLSLVAEQPDLANNVTGLNRQHGGIDIDANALTAIGICEAISNSSAEPAQSRVAIQGFGAVGAELASLLHAGRFRITAVSNIRGAISCKNGLDIPAYHAAWRNLGDAWLLAATGRDIERIDDIHAILTLACDILVPAARTAVIAAECELAAIRNENPHVISAERLVDTGPPSVIAEAANYPLTENAEQLLQDAGTMILPDILINCGGMIGCWHEYDNRKALLGDESEYNRALDACRSRIQDVVAQNTHALLEAVDAGNYARDVAKASANGKELTRTSAPLSSLDRRP